MQFTFYGKAVCACVVSKCICILPCSVLELD